jgi:hypothetical protein
MKDHDSIEVLPASYPPGEDKFVFFAPFFYCGLVPPFSEFFDELMRMYGFRLLDFNPNAVTCMSVFAHLCENFMDQQDQKEPPQSDIGPRDDDFGLALSRIEALCAAGVTIEMVGADVL